MQPLFEVRRYRHQAVTHSHDFHQVVLPLEGQLTMDVDQMRGRVSARSVALIAAGQAHRFTGSRTNSFLVIDMPSSSRLSSDTWYQLLWEHARHQPFATISPETLHLIRYLARATERGELRGSLIPHGCGLLLGAISQDLGVADQSKWPQSLRTVGGYVDTHLEWPLRVADLARAGNVSPSYLYSLFREHLATTPQKFVADRRLCRAAELLAGTSLTVLDVAHRVGYNDQAAFTRAFRRHSGKAPLSYRTSSTSR